MKGNLGSLRLNKQEKRKDSDLLSWLEQNKKRSRKDKAHCFSFFQTGSGMALKCAFVVGEKRMEEREGEKEQRKKSLIRVYSE